MEQPKLTARDLTPEELVDIVDSLREILWPGGKTDESWSPDTIGQVALKLQSYGLEP